MACEKALKADNALTGLAEAAGVFYNATALPCFDIFTQYVECADPTGCGLGNDNLAWDYQVTTVFIVHAFAAGFLSCRDTRTSVEHF